MTTKTMAQIEAEWKDVDRIMENIDPDTSQLSEFVKVLPTAFSMLIMRVIKDPALAVSISLSHSIERGWHKSPEEARAIVLKALVQGLQDSAVVMETVIKRKLES